MPELIDIALAPEEVASIQTMLASLEDAMLFLVGLSPERVKALFKLGPQSEAFVQKTLEAADQHARLLPASTPIAAMRRDAELRETLRPIRARVARLLELLDGTMILAGADLMKSASAVYRTLQIHAKGEGIEDTLEDLGKRFAKRRKVVREQQAKAAEVKELGERVPSAEGADSGTYDRTGKRETYLTAHVQHSTAPVTVPPSGQEPNGPSIESQTAKRDRHTKPVSNCTWTDRSGVNRMDPGAVGASLKVLPHPLGPPTPKART